jgi:C-terminal processing protease CtpA/Prc
MKLGMVSISITVIAGLLFVAWSAGADQPTDQTSYKHGEETTRPKGVIGVSLQVGAERIGDPAVLYVAMVHPEGPAHGAGLAHGDEIVSVDGTPVSGKTYDQVVNMIRGDVGTVVKLNVKGEGAAREVSITRVDGDNLSKGPKGSHGGAGR